MFDSLLEDPYQGDKIADNTFKVRLAIKSKGKGKSGGARVINFLEIEVVDGAESIDLYVLTIYDKSDAESIASSAVKGMINDIKREEE